MEGTEISCVFSASTHARSHYQIINTPPKDATLVTTDDPTEPYQYPPKSIVSMVVRFCSCALCGFGQMCDVVVSYRAVSVLSKSSGGSLYSCFSIPTPAERVWAPHTPGFLGWPHPNTRKRVGGDVEKLECFALLARMQNGVATVGNSVLAPQHTEFSYDPALPPRGCTLKNSK